MFDFHTGGTAAQALITQFTVFAGGLFFALAQDGAKSFAKWAIRRAERFLKARIRRVK